MIAETSRLSIRGGLIFCTLGAVLVAGCSILSTQRDTSPVATAKELVGTWRVASATFFEPGTIDGRPFYGPHPKGRLIFDDSGNYALIVLDSDLLKEPFKSNDRERGTVDENRRVVHGSIANFGRYKVVENMLVLSIEYSTFPNWNGIVQTRRLLPSSAGALKYEVKPASSGGGTAIFVWERD